MVYCSMKVYLLVECLYKEIIFRYKAHLLPRGIDGKKVSDQTNGLALFWTYFYIRICLEPNDLAMSYIETANSSATVSAQICPLFI